MVLLASCPICLRGGASPCDACVGALDPAPDHLEVDGCDDLTALVAYEGPGRELVRSVKYRNHRDALRWIAASLASRMGPVAATAVVTWVPASHRSRRRNGFDHGGLLADGVARALGLPHRRLAARDRGPAQTGLDAGSRRRGPGVRVRGPAPADVVLVDDVVTTGASMGSVARALRAAGAVTVRGVAVAVTPARGDDGTA